MYYAIRNIYCRKLGASLKREITYRRYAVGYRDLLQARAVLERSACDSRYGKIFIFGYFNLRLFPASYSNHRISQFILVKLVREAFLLRNAFPIIIIFRRVRAAVISDTVCIYGLYGILTATGRQRHY